MSALLRIIGLFLGFHDELHKFSDEKINAAISKRRVKLRLKQERFVKQGYGANESQGEYMVNEWYRRAS